MSEVYFYTFSCSAADLAANLRQAASSAAPTLAWMEWANQPTRFAPVEDALQQIEQNAFVLISGSLFGPQAEIQWRRVPADYGRPRLDDAAAANGAVCFWLAAVAEKSLKLPDWQMETQQAAQIEDQKLLLWGSDYTPPQQWNELRIPRDLEYPLTPAPGDWDAAWIVVRNYRDAQANLIASRRVALEAAAQHAPAIGGQP